MENENERIQLVSLTDDEVQEESIDLLESGKKLRKASQESFKEKESIQLVSLSDGEVQEESIDLRETTINFPEVLSMEPVKQRLEEPNSTAINFPDVLPMEPVLQYVGNPPPAVRAEPDLIFDTKRLSMKTADDYEDTYNADNEERESSAAKKKRYDYKAESGDLLNDYLIDNQKRMPEPVLLDRKRDSKASQCCLSWCAPMPCLINFPMVLFIAILGAFLIVVTIFVILAYAGAGNFLIANCPVWVWGTWCIMEFGLFFFWKAILASIRWFVLRNHYRYLKVTFAIYGIYEPATYVLWAACSFPCYILLSNRGVDPNVITWLSRIIWTLLVAAIFWLIWELARRFLIVRIERDKLWSRLALIFWKEKLLRELILAAEGKWKTDKRATLAELYGRKITSSIRYHPETDDMGTLDEFEMWKGKVFDNEELDLDVPRILLARTEEAKRETRMCRLAVHSSQYVFKRLDTDRSGDLGRGELENLFGQKGAQEHLSLWDADNDGAIKRREMIDVVLDILHDREQLKRILMGRSSLGSLLGLALGLILSFVALIVILQIFTISVADIILPLVGLILPVVFIFGNSLRILFESFLVIFIVQPWFPGDYVEMTGFPGFSAEAVSLYVTTGYTPVGVHVSIPNAPALTSAVQNWDRSASGRVRLFFRIIVPEGESVEDMVRRLTNEMSNWVDERRSIFRRGSLGTWMENSDYNDNLYHDTTTCTVCVNVSFLDIGYHMLMDYRRYKGEFIFALEGVLSRLGILGQPNKKLEVVMDLSSLPKEGAGGQSASPNTLRRKQE